MSPDILAAKIAPADASTKHNTTLDTERLSAWLEAHVPGYRGPLDVDPFRGGQSNPTYRLNTASGSYVLRRKPLGNLLAKAHAVDREFRVLSALAGSSVPVPRVYGICTDDTVIGSMFYIMEHVIGRVHWDPRLPDLPTAWRSGIFDSMNETIAALHSLDPAALGLADFGRTGNFLARQVALWSRQYCASEIETIPAMDRLIAWLPERVPEQHEVRLVHGDYRLDNLLIRNDAPKVAAVLDWELATLGNPLADFAYHVSTWRIAPELFRGLANVDFEALGIPPEDAYVAAYCRRTGRSDIEHWDYYVVYSMFRTAAILQGVARRARDGSAADPTAVEVGLKARPLAEQAWAIAQRLS
jgi:aminoglycoside phosphotransferase (APT) family kinase protein